MGIYEGGLTEPLPGVHDAEPVLLIPIVSLVSKEGAFTKKIHPLLIGDACLRTYAETWFSRIGKEGCCRKLQE